MKRLSEMLFSSFMKGLEWLFFKNKGRAFEHHEKQDRRASFKTGLEENVKSLDFAQYGGAPMLGLKGLVVKTHGSSDSIEIRNTIFQCLTFTEQGIKRKNRGKS